MVDDTCNNCRGYLRRPNGEILEQLRYCQCRDKQMNVSAKNNVFEVQAAGYFGCPACGSKLRITSWEEGK